MVKSRKDMRLRLPDVLHDRVQLVADDLGCSINAYVTRVLAQAVRNHVPMADFLEMNPQRGVGKNRHDVSTRQLSAYDLKESHPSGWPAQRVPDAFYTKHQITGYEPGGNPIWGDVNMRPNDEVKNLHMLLKNNLHSDARNLLDKARQACGMEAVSDAQWAATQAWAKEANSGK